MPGIKCYVEVYVVATEILSVHEVWSTVGKFVFWTVQYGDNLLDGTTVSMSVPKAAGKRSHPLGLITADCVCVVFSQQDYAAGS